MNRFGEKLQILRKSRGWSLVRLANELGYSTHSYLSEIESGRKAPSITLILKLSYLFEISCDILMKDELDIF